MAHIKLPEGEPGIIGPLAAYRATEKHLDGLANELMVADSSLTRAEREMIATYVSFGNKCYFCTNSHAAAARHLLGQDRQLVDEILRNLDTADVSRKMRRLLVIADKVRQGGRLVTEQDVEMAREEGADDQAIHDTVLIAAMFCMFNRYVDGLATLTPKDPKVYDQIGARIAAKGYGSRWRADGES
jgi:uncharacterized peroxidase-related enzyme